MKTITVTSYRCDICGQDYRTKKECAECEGQPISQGKGALVGDAVRITKGDGRGERAVVESVFAYDKAWGHYAWKRYWHTVGLTARLVDSHGVRQLTFDDYEMI